MKIPVLDLKSQYLSIKDEIDSAIKSVIDSASFIGGKELSAFEENFAKYCNKKHCAGVDNGTAALFIALKCLGIKEKDEVIIPANTFIATAEAVRMCGAKPVFIDVKEDALMDVEKIEDLINARTKAIIPVHLYGNVCDMDTIIRIAEKHGLIIIEDCAQAHGSKYKGQRIPVSDIGCFSFFPGKNLGAYGDGGAIVTNNEMLHKKFKKFSDHGRTEKYTHDEEGFNFRMDNIQAAILSVKLKYLDSWIHKKQLIAQKYSESLTNQITPPFVNSDNIFHSYHLYVIRTGKRDELRAHLEKEGISTGIHYPIPLHLQPAFSFYGYKKGDFPVAEKLAQEIISLPIYAELDDFSVEKVIGAIKSFS